MIDLNTAGYLWLVGTLAGAVVGWISGYLIGWELGDRGRKLRLNRIYGAIGRIVH